MNPLFKKFAAQTLPPQFRNMQNVMQRFDQFRSTVKGDPKQQVEMLLKSGQMSPIQYQQLQMMASQIQKMMGK